jgi:hypothetical protein
VRIGVDRERASGLGVIHFRAKPGNRAAPGPAQRITEFSVLLWQYERRARAGPIGRGDLEEPGVEQ